MADAPNGPSTDPGDGVVRASGSVSTACCARRTGSRGQRSCSGWTSSGSSRRSSRTPSCAAASLLEAARRTGMRTLRQDAVDRAVAGEISLAEVLRITPDPPWPAELHPTS